MKPARLRLLACLLAPFAAGLPLRAAPAPPSGLAPGQVRERLRRISDHLRWVWQRDPLTAGRPFPTVRLVDSNGTPATPASGCSAAAFPASGPLVLSCSAVGEILVDRAKLAALQGVFGEAAEAFVVAYGLAQSLVAPKSVTVLPGSSPLPSTAGLQAACRAGTLLAALPIPAATRRLVLNNTISAAEQSFPSSAAVQLGTGPQRAYALLSGMGGTSLDCGAAAMARLGSGAVNLEPFLATRGTSVGIEMFCRQPPTCPRRLHSGVGDL